jgi:hypothetical protein
MERWIGDFPTRCRWWAPCLCFNCTNKSRQEQGLPPMSRGPLKYMKTPAHEIGIWDWTGGYIEFTSPFGPRP